MYVTFYTVLADHIQINKSCHVCRIIKRLSTCIASLKVIYIQMAKTGTDRKLIYEDFYNMCQFSKVIGAIDCSHIRI